MERVVVCPYCHTSSPQPEKLGSTYSCSCGAVFALFSEKELGSGLAGLVGDLFDETGLSFGELMDQCQVTVYQGYEAPGPAAGSSVLAEFIKEASFTPRSQRTVHLVWVTKDDAEQGMDGFGQIQN